MDDAELRRNVLERHGLRIQTQMSRYAAKRVAGGSGPFAVIGGDARTGIPRRQLLDPKVLASSSPAASANSLQ